MMIFNFSIGIAGLILSGDSFGQGIRKRNLAIFVTGVAEFVAGIYFSICAIGN